jgi:phytoene desaturase
MHTVAGRVDSVVVVGAGLGGLAAALHLCGSGRQVTVVEREPVPGGRCGIWQEHGYRFDTGPTVLTMPVLLAEALAAVGEELPDWLELIRLDPAYRARFADGSSIDVRADPDAMAEEIRSVCGPEDAAGYRRLLRFLAELYRVELPHFIERNLDSPWDLVGLPLARLAALGGFRRLDRKIAGYLRDERLRRLFTFQAMYAGLAPAQALALYAVITYMDCVGGVYFPRGGMHAVPSALAAAAARHGVAFRYRTAVERIEVMGGRATGVITSTGERIPADAVVVNADLPTAYTTLVPPGYAPRALKRLRYSPSAVVLHAGSSATYPNGTHHVIEFGTAWDATFDEVIRHGELMRDPSFLVTTATLSDASLAPAGRHTYYALFPTPNLAHRRSINWREAGPQYRDKIIETLECRGYKDFGAHLETERLVTPADWRASGIAAGTPFSAAHTFAQTGPFRPSTKAPGLDNLLFCGANTQPGVGVPMVLISGRLAAARITG